MGSITATLFSWNFLIGFILGVIVQRAYCHAQARYLDRLHPNEDGSKHPVRGLNKTWVAYAICGIIIGCVVISTQRTYDLTQHNIRDIKQLAADTADCQRQFNTALIYSRGLNREADDITNRFQEANFDRAAALNKLTEQFGSQSNPEYIKAKTIVDEEYYRKVSDIFQDRKANDARRANNPYPEPSCGK